MIHYSNETEAGMSIEQEIFSIDKMDIGLGFEWNEINKPEYNRTFPIYIAGKINLSDKERAQKQHKDGDPITSHSLLTTQ